MLEPNDMIALSLGSRRLIVMRLRGRFIGLIDGAYYINAESAEAAVGALIRIALRRPDRTEMKKKHSVDSAKLVHAAKKAVGDAPDASLTDAERAAIDEVRRELPRPNITDIKEMARKLAGQN